MYCFSLLYLLSPSSSPSFSLSYPLLPPLGGTINGETSLKEFFYPESGIYRFKPGEGLARCTRYVISDLGAAFPSTTGRPCRSYRCTLPYRDVVRSLGGSGVVDCGVDSVGSVVHHIHYSSVVDTRYNPSVYHSLLSSTGIQGPVIVSVLCDK